MKSRNGIGLVEKALRLAGESCRFLFDRVLEVERLDAEPRLVSMMRPGAKGRIAKQHHEIEVGAQQVAGDLRRSRVEEVVRTGVPGSKSAAESPSKASLAKTRFLQAPAADPRRAGAGENPAFLRGPWKDPR